MSYFQQISSYKTYQDEEYDFHLDYNANSGGGQAFLGGTYLDGSGESHAAKQLEGKEAYFALSFSDYFGKKYVLSLGSSEDYRYNITPRASGSAQMKLGMSGGKVRPSLTIPAALMLPETASINMANSLELSPLTAGNYWLRSMWIDCNVEQDAVRFTPNDFVFGGGVSKQGSYADAEGRPTGSPVFFKFDLAGRAADILYASDDAGGLPNEIAEGIIYFGKLLRGEIPFDYKTCQDKTASVMAATAHEYPTRYSGLGDPLPTIMSEIGRPFPKTLDSKLLPSIINEPRNLIFFGAPGTGKSHNLNKLARANFSDNQIRRVTFYPDYMYSQFVGCFKPMTERTEDTDDKGSSIISYRYVPGPFLETYIDAVKNPDQNYLLIVEEINRANPAAVFGDVFQLLDRGADGSSTYDIAAPVEMRDRLRGEIDAEVEKLRIPANMFIWATMNSADQGVFPMDTAFKRRWSFRYIGIDDGENAIIDGEKLSDKIVTCGGRRVYWNRLRKAINDLMSRDCEINEDKLLGPFFLDPSCLNDEQFGEAFKDKVLMYLYEDAGKARRKTLFRQKGITYSQLCSAFDDEGELVFGGNFDDWKLLADQEYEIDDEQTEE